MTGHAYLFNFYSFRIFTYYLKMKDFVLYHLFILFSSICLNEAVAQLTDEQRWWRHWVRCCSNCRYVLACSQVCAWSTDLPSTCLQVIESVVRVLGIEKRPMAVSQFAYLCVLVCSCARGLVKRHQSLPEHCSNSKHASSEYCRKTRKCSWCVLDLAVSPGTL